MGKTIWRVACRADEQMGQTKTFVTVVAETATEALQLAPEHDEVVELWDAPIQFGQANGREYSHYEKMVYEVDYVGELTEDKSNSEHPLVGE